MKNYCYKCKYRKGCPFKGAGIEHKCGIKAIHSSHNETESA